jgi:hypothetical protein
MKMVAQFRAVSVAAVQSLSYEVIRGYRQLLLVLSSYLCIYHSQLSITFINCSKLRVDTAILFVVAKNIYWL